MTNLRLQIVVSDIFILPKNYIIESSHGTISPLPRSTPHPLLDNALTYAFATVNFLNPTVTSRRISIHFFESDRHFAPDIN